MSIEEARTKMYRCIELYGVSHPLTVDASQELDIVIVEAMKKVKPNELTACTESKA